MTSPSRLSTRWVAWLAVAAVACSSDEPADEARRDEAARCEPYAANLNGHLPACAAGTVSAAGPGVPVDFAGRVGRAMPVSAAEQAAIERANALAAGRNPPGGDPVDRGFGPSARGAGKGAVR